MTAFRLNAKQREINRDILAGPQRHTLLVGGSRSGKTFLLCRAILIRALRAERSRHAILRFRGNAARSSIWLDTLPKVARACFPGVTLKDHRLDGYVSLPNGSEIWIGGLDDKDRVEKILGQEHSSIYLNEASQIPYSSVLIAQTRLAQTIPGLKQRMYYDLNPVGKSHWSHRLFVQHVDALDPDRPLANPEDYRHAFLNPLDNAENLTPEYLASLEAMPPRQRRRFFEGVYVDEIEGALWTAEALAHVQCDPGDVPETLDRVVIAVDPSGTDGDEEKRSDDVGIVVAARGGTGDKSVGYLLADLTCNEPPQEWGRRVVAAYREWGADRIVAEANFGGEMVRAVIQGAARAMGIELPPVALVKASRGKAIRAEPVSVLIGQFRDDSWQGDRIRHAGKFPKLEEELLNFAVWGYQGPRSPNRADAYVWAMTDLMLGEQTPRLWSRGDMELVA